MTEREFVAEVAQAHATSPGYEAFGQAVHGIIGRFYDAPVFDGERGGVK